MPIQNGKYINPGWNNGAPPAIDSTELNAISDTLENLDAGGGSGGGDGKRYARFVIGTSTNGWTAADCDYLCDGVDDQVEINQAIEALSSESAFSGYRGKIVLLDGEYHLGGQLSLLNGISMEGTGGTKLVRGTTGPSYMIGVMNGSIKNIIYDGNSDIFLSGPSSAAEIVLSYNSTITECTIYNFHNIAISTETANTVSPAYITKNKIGGTMSGGLTGINVQNSSLIYIESNLISVSETMISVDGTNITGNVPAQTYILWNTCGGAGSGTISLNHAEGCYVVGNSCRRIVLENTDGGSQLLGSVISHNQFIYSSPLDGAFISLGQGTGWNIVSSNLMRSFGGTGTIQDNGSNNLVVNNITGD